MNMLLCGAIQAAPFKSAAFIREVSHFSAIWRAFDALMFLLEPKGRGGQGCLGLFYCKYSKLRVSLSLPVGPVARGQILERNPDKSLKSFPPFIHRFALRFQFLQITQPLTVSVKEKGGKSDIKKIYPLPFGLRNPYRNLKYENSQDYAQKPQ